MRRALVLVCLVGLVAACGDDDPGAAAPETDTTAVVAADLLAFSADTVAGEPVDASTLSEGDVVVWFWSPWCGSCNQTADGIGRVADELGDQVAFVGIAGGGTQDEYEAFLDDHDLSAFPQLVDETGEIWLRFGADTIRSSFFFIDDTGATSHTGYGDLDEDELRDRVEAMITS